MKPLQIYRKRYIPQEIILLKDDQILFQSDNYIVTSWNTLKPRKDISRGISAYFLDKGYKVSKIYNSQNELVYWYCDIIESSWNHEANSVVISDLLVDILVYPDNSIHVLDMDELQDAYNQSIISQTMFEHALIITQKLLSDLRNGNFHHYKELINAMETKK